MGMRRGPKIWLWPSSVENVAAMVTEQAEVDVLCDKCKARQHVDLPALLAKVGPTYSLINRRCRCRLTPGCTGWNTFSYLRGVHRRLYDDKTWERWLEKENAARREMTRLIREAGQEREEKRRRKRR